MVQVVFALMVEESVEGEYAFMVRSLHHTEEGARAKAESLGIHKHNYYIETMEVEA
ncbi:hypothetical protein [Salmonella phage 7-11]|uniref:Uncharacterized protein n=1 Tax=Salmonella phage 7-11 TaxID=1054968 RepID=G0X4W7_9CAUD|nr:hypothetical protein SaPh711_gp034 [Salmonella phage 7-11]AEK81949.1 hypothetical protein [Salmonella phage 7-11]